KVEHIDAKLQLASLQDRKEPPQRQIHLRQSKAPNVIASFRALPRSIRHGKRGRIERLTARSGGIRHPYRLTWNQVGAGSCIASWRIAVDHGVKRKSAAGNDHRLERPVLGNF